MTLRRKVAIKVLHHELSRDDLAVERFRREATTVAEIDNEHIVEIHDFGRTPDGRLYLAMELLEGETLDAVLAREGQLAVERAVDILIQVGEALMEAHAIGYVHRDLRPRNIFLARAARPRELRQAARLRPGEARRDGGRGGVDQPRHDVRRPALHVARAGARRPHRSARRHLLARLHRVRDARRRRRRSSAAASSTC